MKGSPLSPSTCRYGAKLCGQQIATPGTVLVAFFNVLIGSFGIGYAAPHLQTMAEGRGAAVIVFKTISRVSNTPRVIVTLTHYGEDLLCANPFYFSKRGWIGDQSTNGYRVSDSISLTRILTYRNPR